jgi:hypothetical protein
MLQESLGAIDYAKGQLVREALWKGQQQKPVMECRWFQVVHSWYTTTKSDVKNISKIFVDEN